MYGYAMDSRIRDERDLALESNVFRFQLQDCLIPFIVCKGIHFGVICYEDSQQRFGN